jgi:GH25 family lysozyme M1 (1,4-beta-N-acetylmuramidase)
MTVPLPVHGVDISHHQDQVIGWDKLKAAGVRWMYHKATEGATLVDQNYSRRRAEAKAHNFAFGAYHFARPSGDDAVEEARFFVKNANPQPGDLRPCLDLETKQFIQGARLVEWADKFCAEVERLVEFVPVVYTPYMLSQELEDKAIFWVPRYNDQNERPERDWDIWQFSNGNLGVPDSVPGLGHVDLNFSPKITLKHLRMVADVEPVPPSRGRKVESAIDNLEKAKAGTGMRGYNIKAALAKLRSLKPLRRKP